MTGEVQRAPRRERVRRSLWLVSAAGITVVAFVIVAQAVVLLGWNPAMGPTLVGYLSFAYLLGAEIHDRSFEPQWSIAYGAGFALVIMVTMAELSLLAGAAKWLGPVIVGFVAADGLVFSWGVDRFGLTPPKEFREAARRAGHE